MEILHSNQISAVKKYPSQAVIIEWLDVEDERLAVIAAKHNYEFYSYDSEREYSQFLEQVSSLENDVLYEIEKFDLELHRQIKISGKLIITNKFSEVVFSQN